MTKERASPRQKDPSAKDSTLDELAKYRSDLRTLLEQLDLADAAIAEASIHIAAKDRYIESLRSALLKAEAEYHKLAASVSGFLAASASAPSSNPAAEAAGQSDVVNACLQRASSILETEASWKPTGASAEAVELLNSALTARGHPRSESPKDDAAAHFAACTIVARNYLSHARVWARSLRKHNPGCEIFVLLVDRLEGDVEIGEEPFEVIPVSDLMISDFTDLAFKYNILELCTAVKPFFLEHLLTERGFERVVYFDPDIQVFGALTLANATLGREDIVLVPHIVMPLPDDGKRPVEADFLVSGTYNLGFVGVRKSPDSLEFLHWWQARLTEGGFSRPEIGQFTDQKWIDLVPVFFPRVAVLRHRGYNAAYWNISERQDLTAANQNYRLSDGDLVFFHFSGFEVDRPESVSKYQSRFSLADLSVTYRSLFYGYAEAIRAEGFEETRNIPYAFGLFSDGTPIPSIARRLYHAQGEERRRWSDPFQVEGDDSFLNWLLRRPAPGYPLPRILVELRRLRPDLQQVFPEVEAGHGGRFLEWAIASTPKEHAFPPRFISEFRRLLAQERRRKPNRANSPTSGTSAALAELRRLAAIGSVDPASAGAPMSATKRLLEKTLGRERYRAARAVVWHFRLVSSQFITEESQRPRRFRSRVAEALFGQEFYRRARRIIWEWRRLRSISPTTSPTSFKQVSLMSSDPPAFGVNLFGYFDTESGVGEIARQVAKTLRRAGISHVLRNVEQQWLRRATSSGVAFSDGNPYGINIFCVNADQANHVLKASRAVLPDRASVGYWFWELAKFPPGFRDSFDLLDEVWVASTFCEHAISAGAPIPVARVAPGFDFRPPGRNSRRDFGIGEHDFVVLYAFDANSFVRRKNPAAAVRAFRKAFPEPGRELLLIKTTNARSETIAALIRMAGQSRIRVMNDSLDRGDLLDLIAISDCYLSLHRSEGFGLTILESMAMGKPVIATDYSGSRDFVQESTGFPVPYRLEPIRRAAGPYPRGYMWADPDVDRAAEFLKAIRDDPAEASRRAERARETFESGWSLAAGAKRFRSELRRVWSQTIRDRVVAG